MYGGGRSQSGSGSDYESRQRNRGGSEWERERDDVEDRDERYGGYMGGYGGGDLTQLSAPTLAAALNETGATAIDGGPILPSIVDLLVATGLAKSKGEARRTISEGGAYLNNERVSDAEQAPTADDLIGGTWLVLRRGKKKFAGVEVR
jgi:tyrosyl-tRNA synthetase